MSFAESVFLSLPSPISRAAFLLARKTFRKDPVEDSYASALKLVADRGVEGDFLEFGVYRGASLSTIWHIAQRMGLNDMRFFACDGFAGLPESEGPLYRVGMYSCSRERFEKLVMKAGVDPRRLVVIEGLYEDTLNDETKRRYGLRKAAAIHIDCDLYSSTKLVLDFVEALIGPGTVLMFDDWNCFEGSEFYGERRAFREWRAADRFEPIYEQGHRKGFVCIG